MSEFISWKAQPLFISSTFTDMMAERDVLRDFVFPELAERLRARHIHLEPIDLRWGVETTNKKELEEKELLVLKVCLDEIDRCKPFLIGIIGDRYGWVPPAERMKAAENEKMFVSKIENKSITALEIEYGVLTNTEQMKRSRFYFRAPLDYDQMSPEQAREFSDIHNPELDKDFAEQRLIAYKALVLEKVGKEKVYQYIDLDDFKNKVLEQIWTELDAGTKDQEDKRPKTWQQEEQLFLEEFIEERTIAFSGREDVINHLKEFARSPAGYDNCGLCLTGESGSGKSALFAKLHKELQKENVFILAHAAGISLRSNSIENMLLIWIEELGDKLKIDLSEQLKGNNKFNDLAKLFAELLSRTSVDHRVIVLVDALNQFERTAHAKYVNWLPELLPENVKFIFTAIPGEETSNLSKRKGTEVYPLKSVTKKDAQEIIAAICKRYHKSLNPEVTDVLLNNKTDQDEYAYSNPLWLNMAVDEFLLLDEDDFAGMKVYTGTAEEKLKQLLLNTAYEMPADIEGMYAYLFDKTRQRFGKDFVNAFLSYMAITRYGLRESDFEKLITEYAAQKWEDLKFAALRRYLRAHIVNKGEEGLWDFRHIQVRAGINQLLLSSNEQKTAVHKHIAAHLERLPEDDSLRLTEIMWHLFKADDKIKAAKIYGSFWWNTMQTKEHSRTLLDIMLEDQSNVKWVSSIVELEEVNENVKRTINNNILFSLSDPLQDSIKLGEQIIIYNSVLNSSKYLSLRYPDSVDFIRDLYASLNKIGDTYKSLGDTKNAIENYESCLKITEELRNRNTDIAEFTRDLSICYDRIGNIYESLGDTKSAMASYEISFQMRKKLQNSTPDSSEYANDLSGSYVMVGSIYASMGETKSAFSSFNSALKISEELRIKNPDSEKYNFSLSIIYDRIGDAYIALGDFQCLTTALISYDSSLKIREELRKKNPESVEYNSSLSVSFEKIGNVNKAMGEYKKSLSSYDSSLKIREELRKRQPDSVEYAINVSKSHEKMGDIYVVISDTLSALKNYEIALKIREELRKNNPESLKIAKYLYECCTNIANLYKLFGEGEATLYSHESFLSIAKELLNRNPYSIRYAWVLSSSFAIIAETYISLGDTRSALSSYESSKQIREELRKKDPDSPEYARDLSNSYVSVGNIYASMGDTKKAIESYESSRQIREKLRKKDPGSAEYARDLIVLYDRMGDVYKILGDSKNAFTNYESSLKIAEELRKGNPESAENTRDMSVSFEKIGDIKNAIGDTKSALSSYENSLKMREELLKRNPGSAEYARDLSVSFEKIGDIRKAIGDTKSALASYESSLQIREELLKRNPGSTAYARDLSISYNRLGDIYNAFGNTKNAFTSYKSSLEIREELRKRNPESAEYARDLSVSYNKVGFTYKALGDNKSALTSFKSSLIIREELQKKNPTSDEYARDLSVSYDRMGDIYKAIGDTKSAFTNYECSLKIREQLRERNPDSIDSARDLSISYEIVGGIYKELGDTKRAFEKYNIAIKIGEELTKKAPASTLYAQDLSRFYERIGDLHTILNDNKSAIMSYESALKIREELQKRNPESVEYAQDLVVRYFNLNRRNNLIEILKYMKRKNMFMDPTLVELCSELGI